MEKHFCAPLIVQHTLDNSDLKNAEEQRVEGVFKM